MRSALPIEAVASDRKEETVMKTDLVLTMDEYLNACCVASRVKPPAKDARHVPITTENDADLSHQKIAASEEARLRFACLLLCKNWHTPQELPICERLRCFA